MQFAENGSILDLIHKERRLSEARACNLFRQMVAAVEYCHSQEVCHRDIKCENILLDEQNVVKLIDFGFAKCYKNTPKTPGEERLETVLSTERQGSFLSRRLSNSRQNDDPRLSETYCGSYAYASPEILKGVPYNPFMSDVWALGCVLYAMVCGRLPFDDRDPSKLIKVSQSFNAKENSYRFSFSQQVQSPVNFPTKVEVSDSCKDCIRKFLAPLKSRYNIASLKEDAWLNTAHLGIDQPETIPERRLSTR